MLASDNIKDGDDDNHGFPLFSLCKVFEMNQTNFIEFFKAKSLKKGTYWSMEFLNQ